jgi:hypothetical protein
MATTEAPNPTLAAIARREERYQTGDDEWRKRKRQAAIEPNAAKLRSSGFR